MTELLTRFGRCERGATSIEYGLIATVLSVAIIGATGSIKSALRDVYGYINNGIAGVN